MMGTRVLSAALAGVVLVAAAQVGEDVQDLNVLYPRYIFGSIPLLEKRQLGSPCDPGHYSYHILQVKGSAMVLQVAVRIIVTATSMLPATQDAVKMGQDATIPARYLNITVPYHQQQVCISTINPATVNTVSATPTGCLSGQFTCPADSGGGCCGNGQTCTALASKLYCVGGGGGTGARETGGAAPTTGTASVAKSTSASTNDSGGGGLSSGAKAGIGVGVSLGVILIAGLLAWFILGQRRRGHEATASDSRPPMSSVSSGYGHGNAPTQASPPNSSGADYFSTSPQHGQYSHSQAAGAAGMGAYTPGGYTPSGRGAVPVSPQGPNDIATPVEIAESAVPSPGESGMGSPTRGVATTTGDWKPPPENTRDRMELE
ncbi:MAG: hypothetical protein M1812_003560 [Candelaria pacifica]|nr:MAG: hypothetical protein M1812_003560 [Candelaria pacifica]